MLWISCKCVLYCKRRWTYDFVVNAKFGVCLYSFGYCFLKKKPMYIYSLYTTDLGWKDQRSKKRWHSTAFPIAGKITLNEAAISTALETNTLDSMQLRHIEDVVDVLGKHQCTMRLGDEVCWSNNQFARRFMQRWKTCLRLMTDICSFYSVWGSKNVVKTTRDQQKASAPTQAKQSLLRSWKYLVCPSMQSQRFL